MFHKGCSVFECLPGAGRALFTPPSSPPSAESATLCHSSPLAAKVEQRDAREGEVTNSC